MRKDEYQGWTNYETWLTYSHMSQNESDHNAFIGMARETPKRGKLADLYQEHHEELLDESDLESNQPYLHDLTKGALEEVDWREIADMYLSLVADGA